MPSFIPNSTSDSTTQDYLEIYDITNDIVILRDGSAAMVLSVNSMNFGLLSEEEQDAIIYSYASLLNSLTFPIQIVVRSQRKDITKYLNYLKDIEQKHLMPIRRAQVASYRAFVEGLVKERNILDKKFYVTIPFPETSLATGGIIPVVKKNKPWVIDRAYVLEKALTGLEPRRDHLISQFARIGLQATQLNTQEIIQMFYQVYNPGSADGQQVAETKSYTSPLVQAEVENVSLRAASLPPLLQQQAQMQMPPETPSSAPLVVETRPVAENSSLSEQPQLAPQQETTGNAQLSVETPSVAVQTQAADATAAPAETAFSQGSTMPPIATLS